MQTIPLACNVFSKHNAHHKHENSAIPGHRKKHWKMMWAIDLNEFVGDSRWRVNYWHELRDAKGICGSQTMLRRLNILKR